MPATASLKTERGDDLSSTPRRVTENQLAADEVRLAFLDEGRHAFFRILRGEELAEARHLGFEILGVAAWRALLHAASRRRAQRGFGGEERRHFHRLRQEVGRLEDRVHEPVALGFVGIDHATVKISSFA